MSQYACHVIDFLIRGSLTLLYIYLAVKGLKSVFRWIKKYKIIIIDGSTLRKLHNDHKPL